MHKPIWRPFQKPFPTLATSVPVTWSSVLVWTRPRGIRPDRGICRAKISWKWVGESGRQTSRPSSCRRAAIEHARSGPTRDPFSKVFGTACFPDDPGNAFALSCDGTEIDWKRLSVSSINDCIALLRVNEFDPEDESSLEYVIKELAGSQPIVIRDTKAVLPVLTYSFLKSRKGASHFTAGFQMGIVVNVPSK
jgi:hypothetical protein